MKRISIITCTALPLLCIFACSESELERVSVWTVIAIPELKFGKPSLFAVDGRPAAAPWAVGENGTILTYDDYLWEEYGLNVTESSIYDIDISSGSSGWAVGAGGTMLQFINGDWLLSPPVCTVDLYAVALDDNNGGWAVGDAGCILRFDGTEWTVFEHNATNVTLNDVSIGSNDTAWAVGDAGTVLFYDRTGWESIPSPTPNTLYSVATIPANGLTPSETYICGDGGAFFEFTNLTWYEIDIGTTATLRDICLYDNTRGFVVGERDSLYEMTSDGWVKVDIDFPLIEEPISLKDVTLTSATEGWAVGSNGVILRYGPAENWHGDLMKDKWREYGDIKKEKHNP
ncbi:MAG: hypothetical protein JSW52_02355 [Candidatus Coatesbacteria bacterium]|nr:MAG: hypothetical protein JSW52_02355 [Candidatus Coatesbacteria bacterium]